MSFVDHIVPFELSQSALCCSAFGNAIVAANATENSLAEDFDSYTHTSPVGELFRFSVNKKWFISDFLSTFVKCKQQNFPIDLPELSCFWFELQKLSNR